MGIMIVVYGYSSIHRLKVNIFLKMLYDQPINITLHFYTACSVGQKGSVNMQQLMTMSTDA
jgi:hypothetical protein